MRLARSTVARRIGCGSRARSYASTSSASSSILADLAAGNLRTGGSSRARSTRSALPAHSGKVTLSDWSHLEELAGGLRAPMAVRIKDLIQSAEDLQTLVDDESLAAIVRDTGGRRAAGSAFMTQPSGEQ